MHDAKGWAISIAFEVGRTLKALAMLAVQPIPMPRIVVWTTMSVTLVVALGYLSMMF